MEGSLRIRRVSLEDVAKFDDGNHVLVLGQTFPVVAERLDQMLKSLEGMEVAFRRNRSGEVTKARASLGEVQKELESSCHHDSILLMDEDVLSSSDLLDHGPSYLRADWFQHFPKMLRPSPLCLIVGGTGARSELHADPLSWTGWNCLLRGTKLWRFYQVLPGAHERRPFGIRGLCSVGAGWVSPEDAFTDSLNSSASLEYLQQPGETLIFPAHSWHQTYHLTPTLSLAGQLLNQQNLRRVMGHVIDWCQLKVTEDLWRRPPEEVIAHVLGDAIDSM